MNDVSSIHIADNSRIKKHKTTKLKIEKNSTFTSSYNSPKSHCFRHWL